MRVRGAAVRTLREDWTAVDWVGFFASQRWTAGVVGLGYVGLPLAVNAVERGLRAIGYDTASTVSRRLNAGSSHIEDVSDARLRTALDAGLAVTSDPSALRQADAILIAVPSPLTRDREPDMRYIESAAELLSDVVRVGQLISLESTTYPGTTEGVIVPAATSGGLRLDEDIWIAFSPERLSPGENRPLRSIPKVVGGVTELSGRVAAAAYGRMVESVHLVSSARAAEMTKLLENTYRAVNIGFVNEVAQITHAMGIDIWEVIEAAATKPFGFHAFRPGPGVGGHCIPLDPHYLRWSAEVNSMPHHFIDLADQVNRQMPEYTARRILDLLEYRGVSLTTARILVVGLAFKRDVSDIRESPALDVLTHLARAGADVDVFDPLVNNDCIREHGHNAVVDTSGAYDIAVILTDHSCIDVEALAASVPVVFDTRGTYRERGSAAPNVVPL